MEVVKQLCKAVLDRDYGDIRQYAYEVGKKGFRRRISPACSRKG